MKKLCLSLIAGFCFSTLVAQEVKKVVIIGIDGCRPDALEQAHTPHLDALIANGIYSPDALMDDITVTGPGWSAVLCGVWSDKHDVVDNSFSPNNFSTYPSLFKRLEEYDSTLHTYSLCSWDPINDNIVAGFADNAVNVPDDADVAAQGADYLLNNDPDLSFLYFEDVDFAGHSDGFSPSVPAYISEIEIVDGYVGGFMQAIQNRPTYNQEDWLIIVTTDHGGIGTEHGGNTIEEKNVFMIVSGNSVDHGLIERTCYNIADTVLNCLNDTTALLFPGDGERVAVNQVPLFDFGANQDFTVECRVRTDISADVAIVGNKDWDAGLNPGWVFSFSFPNGPEWKVNVSDGNQRADINTGGEIADNEWHTLTVTFDRDDLMTLYEDGAFVASTDMSMIGNINTGGGLSFGADILGEYAYTGMIAEVRIWDTLLNASTINAWQCDTVSASHPNYANLIGYWRMNEGSGNTVCVDHSPHGNDGNVMGAQWVSLDSISVCDYSNTPRLTDVFPTAFAHLCVPVETSWGLEGSSLLPVCNPSSAEEAIDYSVSSFSLWPNPANDQITIVQTSTSLQHSHFEVYDLTGKLLIREEVKTQKHTIDISMLKSGIYQVRKVADNQPSQQRVFVK